MLTSHHSAKKKHNTNLLHLTPNAEIWQAISHFKYIFPAIYVWYNGLVGIYHDESKFWATEVAQNVDSTWKNHENPVYIDIFNLS